jgi:hypothetical protein
MLYDFTVYFCKNRRNQENEEANVSNLGFFASD